MGLVGSLEQVIAAVAQAKQQGQRVVLGNGAFDLLHVGHVRYLKAAKALGDCLVVAVNADSSVQAHKGSNRPIIPQDERAELLAELACVDWVLIFQSPTVLPILSKLRPHVHAKGTDYTPDTVPEAAFVREYGGQVAICGDAKRHSTSWLMKYILSSGEP